MSVVFDWGGSLNLAKALHVMAGELTELTSSRTRLATTALAQWIGTYSEHFVGRIDDEVHTGASLAAQLRAEAEGWAIEWQKAMDQENWDRYQAAKQRVENQRSNWDKFSGWALGHDDLPNTPSAAARPVAPHFAATRSFADYSRY